MHLCYKAVDAPKRGEKALVRFSAGLAGIALISSVVCNYMCLINGAGERNQSESYRFEMNVT